MDDPQAKLAELLASDHRYRPQAYPFVFDALRYAQEKLGRAELPKEKQRHVTGQELCEAIREFALEQFGLLALTVLRSWGITRSADFGQIVFNLIRSGLMKKTDRDSLQDFEDVYDFEEAFRKGFHIKLN